MNKIKSLKQNNFFSKLTPRQKVIGLFFGILFLIAIPLAIITNQRIHSAKISFFIAPSSAIIKFDGREIQSGIKPNNNNPEILDINLIEHQITPGKHIIEISKDGFTTITDEVELKKGDKLVYYNYLLQEDGSMDWYGEHEEESRLLETIIPSLAQSDHEKIEEKYPLIKILPLKSDYYINDYTEHIKYDISYTLIDDQATIKITDRSGGNKELALEKIRSLGYNPDDYKIEYIEAIEQTGWGKSF